MLPVALVTMRLYDHGRAADFHVGNDPSAPLTAFGRAVENAMLGYMALTIALATCAWWWQRHRLGRAEAQRRAEIIRMITGDRR
jgi:hypothetical protein